MLQYILSREYETKINIQAFRCVLSYKKIFKWMKSI